MDLSKKVFGANVNEDIRGYIEDLQKGDFEIKPGSPVNPIAKSYLGDRTPYVRMWTAISTGKVEWGLEKGTDGIPIEGSKKKWNPVGDSEQKVYSINENRHESYSELDSIKNTESNYKYNPDLQKNPYLKPPAGIKSINSKSEGAVGALRRTTVDFVVHNKNDFDTIYLPFFFKLKLLLFIN